MANADPLPRMKDWIGRIVVLKYEVTTYGRQQPHPVGTRCRVYSTWRGRLSVDVLNGTERTGSCISRLSTRAVTLET